MSVGLALSLESGKRVLASDYHRGLSPEVVTVLIALPAL